ncbi:MAG: pseudouridine synthase [Flavobacteriales bacterium]|nr:pseudouridine synthase [Flavobacteriales bacterium]|tara:strand:- start:308 stop:1018 length:711 start_codon:yes stop_codon:yes gene_type:complete
MTKKRINKFIAEAGVCSRRNAEKYVTSGQIEINGKIIKDLSYVVSNQDIVKLNGIILKSESKKYILLNKPKNFITTMNDEKNRKTVMSLVKNSCNERIYPVGRLDKDTTGLLLFTNNGEIAKKLLHPKSNIKKIYHIILNNNLKLNDLNKIKNGIKLNDGIIKVDKVSYVDGLSKNQIGIEIHSGKNRIVRRIFEYLNYKVLKLDRVFFAGLTKNKLKRGTWRPLTQKEIDILHII